MTTNGDTIFMVYRTDEWHTTRSRELVYIGTTKADCIAQIVAYRECTEEQADELREHTQSQCNGIGYEWEIEEVTVGTFQD